MAYNSQPPTKSPASHGIDWGKAKEKFLVGGVTGGLVAFIVGVLSIIKRRKN
jgi:hypothetical protein